MDTPAMIVLQQRKEAAGVPGLGSTIMSKIKADPINAGMLGMQGVGLAQQFMASSGEGRRDRHTAGAPGMSQTTGV